MYKAMASCENCETITCSGVYKSAMAQVTCTMEYGICTLGNTYCCPRVQIPYNYGTTITGSTLYSLQCTPQPTIPTNQSYYSQHTSTHNHSKTMNIGNYGGCGWKDRCRDGNLRTYCHVSPILFSWFFVEASPTCFCIFVKCFFCNFIFIPSLTVTP